MKVAFITEHYPRLYHTFIRHEIAGLVERGAHVAVFSFFRDPSSRNLEMRPDDAAHEVIYFEDHVPGRSRRLARAASRRERTIGRIGAGLHHLVERAVLGKRGAPDPYGSDLGWIAHSFGAIASMIRADRFDVIHAGFGNKSTTAAMLLSRTTGVPFSFETHAYDLYVDFKFAREKIREARNVFTISNYNRDFLIREHRCPPNKVEVMRVSFDKAQCDRRRNAERSSDLVVSVGRLHPIKGLTYAVEAMKRVARRRPVKYLIIGDGPLKRELRAQIRRFGSEPDVELRGDLSNSQALEFVSRAAVFLLPSVIAANGDRDGIPTSLLEAMYLGTPVVSSRVSGIPELVEDGVSGFLVEQGDVVAIAKCVEQLLADASLRYEMGRAARERVRTGFYREDSADTLMRCWRSSDYRCGDGENYAGPGRVGMAQEETLVVNGTGSGCTR